MRIVVALGGNALMLRGKELTMAHQREAVSAACDVLAAEADDHQLVVTHGTEPQVGLLAKQNAAYDPESDVTLDILDAESAAMVGYLLEQELGNRLTAGRSVVTVLTTTLVSLADPAFSQPSAFVGPVYDADEARRLEHRHGWRMSRDGAWYRRLVPAPRPQAVQPMEPVDVLLDLGYVVICGGGGGVPVAVGHHGFEGVEAVIDTDAVSALIAEQLRADLLVIATDVDGVYEGWGTPHARRLHLVDVLDLDVESLPEGTMRPKVEAAVAFARTGGRAVIGSLSDLHGLVAGTAGTRVVDSRALAAAAARTGHPRSDIL